MQGIKHYLINTIVIATGITLNMKEQIYDKGVMAIRNNEGFVGWLAKPRYDQALKE